MIRPGAIICAKSIVHRIPHQITDSKKGGRQRVQANQFTYGFQSPHNLLSEVGIFVYLGVYPEQMDGDVMERKAQQRMRALGWHDTTEISATLDKIAEALKTKGMSEADISDLFLQAGIDKGR